MNVSFVEEEEKEQQVGMSCTKAAGGKRWMTNLTPFKDQPDQVLNCKQFN